MLSFLVLEILFIYIIHNYLHSLRDGRRFLEDSNKDFKDFFNDSIDYPRLNGSDDSDLFDNVENDSLNDGMMEGGGVSNVVISQ